MTTSRSGRAAASSRGSFAAAVSAAIRRAVIRPLPSGTRAGVPGVRVQAGLPGTAVVNVDLTSPALAARTATAIIEALTEQGYVVEANRHDPTILTVARPTGDQS